MKLQRIFYTLLLSVFSFYYSFGKTITVTNTNTLATAIADANKTVGADVIVFDKSLKGTQITLTAYQSLTDAAGVTINGDIDGDNLPDISIVNFGLVIPATGSNNFIKNLNFYQNVTVIDYLPLQITGNTNQITNCYFGTDLTGTKSQIMGIETYAVQITGNSNIVESSLIVGYPQAGIYVTNTTATKNTFRSNIIGLNKNLEIITSKIPYGIYLNAGANDNNIGDVNPGYGNIISNTTHAIRLNNVNNTIIVNNVIGRNTNFLNPYLNDVGIYIEGTSTNTKIGNGTAIGGNVFEYNTTAISVPNTKGSSPTNSTIDYNFFGTSKDLKANANNQTDIRIQVGNTNTIKNNYFSYTQNECVYLWQTESNYIYNNTFRQTSLGSKITLVEANSLIAPPIIDKFDPVKLVISGKGQASSQIQLYGSITGETKLIKTATVTALNTWSISLTSAEIKDIGVFYALQTGKTNNTSPFSPPLCFSLDNIGFGTSKRDTLACGNSINLQLKNYTSSENTWVNWYAKTLNVWSYDGYAPVNNYTNSSVVKDTIYVEITKDGCTKKDSMIVTLEGLKIQADTDGVNKLYVTGNADINLNAYNFDETHITSSLWTIAKGTGSIVDNKSYNTLVKGIGLEDNKFVWTQTTKNCVFRDTVTFHRVASVNIANAGKDMTTCSSSAKLDGNFPGSSQRGEWKVIEPAAATNVYFGDISDAKTFVNGLQDNIKYILRWSLLDAKTGTIMSSDDIIIDNRKILYELGNNLSICSSDVIVSSTLLKEYDKSFNFKWVSDYPELTFKQNNDTSYIIGGFVADKYYNFQAQSSFDKCFVTEDFSINRLKPVNIYAGNDTLVNNATLGITRVIQKDVISTQGTYYPVVTHLESNTKVIYDKLYPSEEWKLDFNLSPGKNTFIIDGEYQGYKVCFNPATLIIIRRILNATIPNIKACGTGFSLNAPNLQKGQIGKWSIVNNPTSAKITFVDTGFPQSPVTIDKAGVYTFRWEVTQNGYTDFQDITVTISASLPNFFADLKDTLTTSATSLQLNASNHTATWSSPNTAITFSPNNTTNTASVTNFPIGYTKLYWMANDECKTKDSVIVKRVYPANAGTDQLGLCSGSFNLNANAIDLKATGQWTVVGTGVTITSPTKNTTAVSVKNTGNYQFVWSVWATTDPTVINRDTVLIQVKDVEKVNTISTITTNYPITKLTAIGDVDSILWISNDKDVLIEKANSFETLVRKLKVGPNTFILRDLGVCPTPDITVNVTYDKRVNAGFDEIICDNLTATLAGTIALNSTAKWSKFSGKGTAIFSPTHTINNPTVTVSDTGNYVFVLEMTDGVFSDFDTINVRFGKTPVLKSIGLTSTTADNIELNVVDKNNPTKVLKGFWESELPYTFKDKNTAKTNVSGLTIGKNLMAWSDESICPNWLEVEITRLPISKITEPDTIICKGNSVIYNANVSGQWLDGTGKLISTGLSFSFLGANVGTKIPLIFKVTQNGVSNSDTVYITVQEFENALADKVAGGDQLVFTDNTNLNGQSKVTGFWSSTDLSLVFANKTSKTTTVSNLKVGPNKIYWTSGTGKCATTDTMVVGRQLSVNAGTDILNSCVPIVQLNGNVPTIGTGKWSFSPTTAKVSITNTADPKTSVTFTDTATVIFTWTISENGISFSDDVKVQVIETKKAQVENKNISTLTNTAVLNSIGDNTKIRWEIDPKNKTTETLTSTTAISTTINNLVDGKTINVFLYDEDGCPTKDTVQITYNKQVIANAGISQDVCGLTTTLNATSAPLGYTNRWKATPNVTFKNDVSNNTEVTFSQNGTYILTWMIEKDGLLVSQDTMTVKVTNFVQANIITTDLTTTLDKINVSATGISTATGLWSSNQSNVFSSSTGINTEVSNLIVGKNIIKWTVTAGTKCITEDSITITRLPIAEITTTDTLYCQGDMIDLTYNQSSTSQFIQWFDENGNPIFNTSFPVINTGKHIKYVLQVTENGFSNRDSIYITVQEFEKAFILKDSLTISTDTITINSENTIAGKWSSPNKDIVFTNNKASKLVVGPNTLIWTTGTDECTSSDTIIVTRNLEVFAGNDTSYCSPTFMLNATAPTIGKGTWTYSPSNANISIENANLHNTKVTFLEKNEVIFTWKVSENGYDFSDDVIISVNDVDVVSVGNNKKITVLTDTLELNAFGDIENIEWIVIQGGGIFDDATDVTTVIRNLPIDTKTIIQLNDNDDCPSFDVLEITYTSQIIAYAGEDTTICGLEYILQGNNVDGVTTYWDAESFDNINLENKNDGTTKVSFAKAGTYELTWVIEQDGGNSFDKVTIKVNDIEIADIVEDDFITNTPTITVSTNNKTALWSSPNQNLVFENPTNLTTKVSNLEPGQNFITLTVGEECPTVDEIIVTYTLPISANAGNDTRICDDIITIKVNEIPFDAIGILTNLESTSLVNIQPTSNPTEFLVTNLQEGPNTFVWTVENEFESAIDSVTITASLNIPTIEVISITTKQTKFDINISKGKKEYDSFTYQIQNPQKGTIEVKNDIITYNVLPKALGEDTIYYSFTNQCELSSTNKVILFIENSAPETINQQVKAEIKKGGILTFNILDSIIDVNFNIDPTKISIESFSAFGANAILSENGNLILNYSNINLTGIDSISYSVCDEEGACLQGRLRINVLPIEGGTSYKDVLVYNALSPNNDGKQDFVLIDNLFDENNEPRFPNSKFTVFDRWGKIITTINGYDNNENRWEGLDSSGKLVPQGTYYYAFQIDADTFVSGFILVNYK